MHVLCISTEYIGGYRTKLAHYKQRDTKLALFCKFGFYGNNIIVKSGKFFHISSDISPKKTKIVSIWCKSRFFIVVK